MVFHSRLCLGLLLAAGVVLAGCASPADSSGATVTPPSSTVPSTGTLAGESTSGATAGASGGAVGDVAPTIESFEGSASGADNSGSVAEIFTLTLFDANGEKDFRDDVVTIALTGASTGSFTHTIAADEANADTLAPATFGADGFKVWTGSARVDGKLVVQFRYTYALGAPAGTYTFTPSVTPNGGSAVAGSAKSTDVQVFSEITVASAPVALDGAPTATNWGLWTATPGASNVESTNFMKLVNTGQNADARVVIDFTESAFTSPDPDYPGIPINGNIQFAVCEVATGALAPSACSFTYAEPSADGSVSLQFSGLEKAIFVKYRVVSLPSVLPAGSYGASYTATEL